MAPGAGPRPGPRFGTILLTLVILTALALVWRLGLTPWARAGTARPAEAATVVAHQEAPPRRRSAHPPSASTAKDLRPLLKFAHLGLPVRCGAGTKPLVALTFDDGPGPYTRQTMHILRAAGAHATFFVVGKKLDDGSSYDTLPTDEWRLGAVGDHTWSHVYLPRLTDLEIRDEILRTRDALEAMTGRRVVLFRPPYGTRDPRIDTQVRWLGMLEVLWSVDSGDSTNPGPQQVLATVVADARPGSIVLMHENRGATLSILPQLLRDLAAKGLQPVSVPELLSLDPPTEAQLTSGTCP